LREGIIHTVRLCTTLLVRDEADIVRENILEPGDDHPQDRRVTRMARLAVLEDRSGRRRLRPRHAPEALHGGSPEASGSRLSECSPPRGGAGD